jgi:hypothetical protein
MTVVRSRKKPDGFSNVSALVARDFITWYDDANVAHRAPADKRLTKLRFDEARLARQGTKYPHRRHYEGHYWFEQTRALVWHESMTEYSALMELDHRESIRAITSQPMCIHFVDGTRHYPDYFAVLSNGSQVLYDVRPPERIDARAEAQFEKTEALCEEVGWAYQVLHGSRGPDGYNLEWLSCFRHVWYRPDDQAEARILDFVGGGRPFAAVAKFVENHLGAGQVHAIYNLMWRRLVRFDESALLHHSAVLWTENANV